MKAGEKQPNSKLTLRKILQGTALILISNLVYIGNNYIVAWTELKAPEIALVRGVLQVVIFGVIVWRGCRAKAVETIDEEHLLNYPGPKVNRLLLYSQIFLYGFTVSTMSFACLAAIPLMPIGDLIVISFTSPVFSVFLDRIILKRLLTFLSVGLCFLIVLGDVLVVQPPIIFGEEDSVNDTIRQYKEADQEEARQGQYYYLGVSLCFYAAAAGAIANVVGARCNKMNISPSHLMLVSGFSSILLSLASSPFLPNRLLTDPQSLSLKASVLLPASAGITMIAYWTITLAISITSHPTLISMLRSTEILISLGTEALWWNQLPGTISLLGSLLVSACVLCMAAHDRIVATVARARASCWGRGEEQLERDSTRL